MNVFFLLSILFSQLKNPRFFFLSLLFAALFISLALVALNFTSYTSFISADYPLLSRLYIIWLITVGSFSAVETKDVVFLFITALLFGLNTQLVVEKIRYMRKAGSLKLTFGAGIISLVATGCASCGLSLASLAGLTGVILLLPFGGLELYGISIAILLLLLLYNLKAFAAACKILPPKKSAE